VDIAIDFVTGLPLCENMYAILMVVDRLSKERHYIACKADEQEDLAVGFLSPQTHASSAFPMNKKASPIRSE